MEKEGKTYSMDMRFHVYDLLVNNVPTKNIPILIEKYTKRLGITVGNMLACKPPHGQLTPQCAFHNLQPSPQVTDPSRSRDILPG
jgi:hypothetical protein